VIRPLYAKHSFYVPPCWTSIKRLDIQEIFDEIAGRLEFDAGFSQEQAEAAAQEIVKARMQQIGGTRDFVVFCISNKKHFIYK
jgi:hypothetical protein